MIQRRNCDTCKYWERNCGFDAQVGKCHNTRIALSEIKATGICTAYAWGMYRSWDSINNMKHEDGFDVYDNLITKVVVAT